MATRQWSGRDDTASSPRAGLGWPEARIEGVDRPVRRPFSPIYWYPAPGAKSDRGPVAARRTVSPWALPTVLDAIIPGVGHLFAGRRRRGLLLLAPMLIALAAVVIIAVTSSPARIAASLVDSGVLSRR